MSVATHIAGSVAVAAWVLSTWGPAPVSAQQHGYTRADVENGARLYQASCATCHGATGEAIRGVSLLTGGFSRATSDEQLVDIVLKGIPDTAMPPSQYSPDEAGMIVAYLRSATTGERVTATAGDAARGRAIFDGKGGCTTCHGPGGSGTRMAPSLRQVGALRRPLEIERALVDPSADLHPDFRFVRLVTRGGDTVTGRLLNQSTFSIQILDTAERLRAFDRSELTHIELPVASPMPSVRGRLDDQELADVLAYLMGMRSAR